MSRTRAALSFVSSGIATLALACATSPTGRSQLILVDDAQMAQMGVDTFQQLKSEGKVSTDPKKNAYVRCVADAITGALPPEWAGDWEVVVFEDPTANAFALPGRKIGVHTGLLTLAKNQDQLATVMGHEVAHVIARHGAARVSNQLAAQGGVQAVGVLLGAAGDPSNPLNGLVMEALGVGAGLTTMAYGRDDETEADVYGLKLMAAAGFDPRESVPLWQNMAAAAQGARPPEFLSTHPNPETRIQDLQTQIPKVLPLSEQARAAGRAPTCG